MSPADPEPIADPIRTGRSRFWLSLVVLVAGLLLTAQIARFMQSAEEEMERIDFEFHGKEIEGEVLNRLQDCEAILRSGVAFFAHGPEHISREEWRRFIADQTRAGARWSGIQGVGFAQAMARADLPRHVAALRAEGFPDYEVRPAGDRETYSAIIYLEPFADRNLRALGYDMLSETVRRAAMERARDENAAALSGSVVLVQETDQDIQAGTLMYLPVYRWKAPLQSVADRRAALLGWVYSPYRMDDLMGSVRAKLTHPDGRTMRLEVFDGDVAAPTALLHDSARRGPRPPEGRIGRTREIQIKFAGCPWTLRMTRTNPETALLVERSVWVALVGGTSTSLFLAGLVFSLLNTRFKARRMAWQLTGELRSSEERFRAIADYTVDLGLWFDHDGKIVWVSPSVERMTGYSPAAVRERPDFLGSIATTDGANAESLAALGRALALGGSDSVREFQCHHKDGTRFWLSLSWQPIFDRSARPLGLRASGRDVTLIKELEGRLLRANLVVEQSHTSIVVTDLRGATVYVNAEFTRQTGYTDEEMRGQNPRILQSGHTPRAVYVELWQSLTAGASWHGEFQNRKKNGENYWETVTISPLREPDGRIAHYVAVKQDVTERKKLQLKLQASETRFVRLAEQTGTFVWQVDAHGLYTYVSPLAERVLGYRPDEMVGRMHFYDLHPSAGREEFRAVSLAALGRGRPIMERIAAAQTKDGRLLWLSTTGEAEWGADGSLLGYAGSDTDVTARRLQERATLDNLRNFRGFFEYTTDLVFVGGADGKLIATNQAVGQTLGYSEAELRSLSLLDMHPKDSRLEAESFCAAVSRGERERCPLPLQRKDGGLVPAETRLWFGQWNGRNCLFMVAKNLSEEQEAQQRFERMFRANPSLMALASLPDERFVDVNDAFMRVLGFSQSDTIGKTAVELGLFSAPDRYRELMQEQMAQGHINNVELHIRRKDGEVLVGLLSGEVVVNQGRNFLLLVINDITAIQRMAAAVQESNERLNLAVRAGGVGIWDFVVGEDKLVCDDQMLRLYGLTREGFNCAYDRWRHGLHAEDRLRWDGEIQAALRGEKDFNTEFRVVWPDGSVHDIRALAVVQRDAHGRALRMIGTNWDITEEKQAASRLRRNESLLQLMFQASPLGFLVVDNRTDAILHFNERFCELWGITHLAEGIRRGELKNNDIIPDCLPMLVDVPAFAASCVPLQDVDNRTTIEDEIAFVEGRTIRRYSTQIRDQMDDYHGRFYIFEDITGHKRLEAEIAANLEKERQVSAMKTRFISVTSHEFRTPMAAAMVSVDTLQNHLEQLAPAKRTELFGRIHTSMRRMTTMLDEVLVLSRMDAGRSRLNLEPIAPVAFTEAVIAEVQAGDRAAHRFEFHAEGSAGPFVTEPNLLHQILSNLLSNAVRYSPAGTPIVTSLAADCAGVRVTVEDRGIGIPEADRARIFEPFERGSNVGNIKGTGLGLNIVQRMTEKLGGTIAYEAVPVGGSRFILILPRGTPSPS